MREAFKADSGIPRFRSVGHLRHGVVSYVWVVGIMSAMDGAAIWSNPNLLQAPPYSWVGNLASWWMWSLLFGLIAVGAAVVVRRDYLKSCPSWLVAATLGAHGSVCAAFGASIARQVVEGSPYAVIGAGKWLAFTAGALWMARQQTLYERAEWDRAG